MERMALNSLQETLMTVVKLIPLLTADGKSEQAEQLAGASRTECEAFGLWQYSAYLAQMQLAVSSRDIKESIRLIAAMLRAAETPWDLSACPLFCHQLRKENAEIWGKISCLRYYPSWRAILSMLFCGRSLSFRSFLQSIGKKSDRRIESKKLRWTSSFTRQALAVWKPSGSGMVQPLAKS